MPYASRLGGATQPALIPSTRQSMTPTEHECLLTASPRSDDSEQELESHWRKIHPLSWPVLQRFNRTCVSDDENYRIGPGSIGNLVSVEYVTCDFCGERKTVPERNLSKCGSFFCDPNWRSEYYTENNHPGGKNGRRPNTTATTSRRFRAIESKRTRTVCDM